MANVPELESLYAQAARAIQGEKDKKTRAKKQLNDTFAHIEDLEEIYLRDYKKLARLQKENLGRSVPSHSILILGLNDFKRQQSHSPLEFLGTAVIMVLQVRLSKYNASNHIQ
jgi:hypothetical protein